MDKYFNSYREMLSLRGLADHTLTGYCTYIRSYLDYLSNILHKQPEDVSWQELRDYILWLQKDRSLSDRTINASISQLRFFTMYVLHKPWDPTQLPMRRFEVFLPFVPSRDEVLFCINSIPDKKERAMVVLLYSSGLRVGEVCSLRYEDIERKAMRIHVRHSKNRQDRYAILSKQALDILTDYWFSCGRPTAWLFPSSMKPDEPYSPKSFSNKFVTYRKTLGWNERLTSHSFRHAFGTHLYENGTNLLTIKALLGHRSINSTTVYVHLASNSLHHAVSPFDRIGGVSHG